MKREEALSKIKDLLGPSGWTDGDGDLDAYLVDSRGAYRGRCAGLARPDSTVQVAEVVRLCAAAMIPIVPQGGNTGRVAGATPDDSGDALLLNLSRMNRIREVDSADYSMTVEAGCILKTIQDTALAQDRYFPLSLGAEGSCQIGGNLASNAGGINVLRYGNTRELVLGIEAVLPNGEIWNGLSQLRKNNTGYDLKHLMIGSEGTLGIITAAVLRLFPKPTEQATALCALSDLDSCLGLLALARSSSGDAVSSFELIPAIAIDCAVRHVPGTRAPFSELPDWAVLLEFSGTGQDSQASAHLEAFLEQAFESGLIADAVIAQSEQQRSDLWHLREAIVEAQAREGASIKHDVSVAISQVPEFLRRAAVAIEDVCPGIRPYPFGHVGDGNIHYNLTAPVGMEAEAFRALEWDLHRAVHDIVAALNGSISAEHGIGQVKRGEMARYKSSTELTLMRGIKQVFDPQGIMNPGKVLPEETSTG